MSFEIIALIILVGSLTGMALIIWRKLPVLAELPEKIQEPGESLFLRLKNKVANLSFIRNFSFALFLQKILSKIRVLTLRIENKTADWLQKLREKSQKKKNFDDDNYWQELKNSKDQENKKDKTKPM
jgi:hypothetical protein